MTPPRCPLSGTDAAGCWMVMQAVLKDTKANCAENANSHGLRDIGLISIKEIMRTGHSTEAAESATSISRAIYCTCVPKCIGYAIKTIQLKRRK
jgi:hypothetical protein